MTGLIPKSRQNCIVHAKAATHLIAQAEVLVTRPAA